MGLILTIQWKSNEEKNVEWVHSLTAAAQPLFGTTLPSGNLEITSTFVIKQVTSGCGTCGDHTAFYRERMEKFAQEVCNTVLADAENVSWDIRKGGPGEF